MEATVGQMIESTEEKKDSSQKKKVADGLEDKYLAMKAENLPFDVEAWYPLVSHLTAPTTFLPLSEKEALAIKCYYQTRFAKRNNLTQELALALRNLRNRIAESAKASFGSGSFFVRLSSRSPKDGYSHKRPDVVKQIEKAEEQIKVEWKDVKWPSNIPHEHIDINYKVVATFRVGSQSLLCPTADHAMSLILSSERVFHDINVVLTCAEAERTREDLTENWTTKVILRKWQNNIDDLFEFRCFVKDNKLTAISQYNHYVLVGPLFDENLRESIRKKLFSYWVKELKTILLEKKDYIVDLAVLKDGGVYLIELNPYANTTGPSLYNWNIDKELLEGRDLQIVGDDHFSYYEKVPLRIRTEAIPNMDNYVEYMIEQASKEQEEPSYTDLLDEIAPVPKEEKKCQIF